MRRPATLIEVVAATARDEKFWQPAMAGFLDTFYMEPERPQAMIDPEPPMTGDAIRDASLAAGPSTSRDAARLSTRRIPGAATSRRRLALACRLGGHDVHYRAIMGRRASRRQAKSEGSWLTRMRMLVARYQSSPASS